MSYNEAVSDYLEQINGHYQETASRVQNFLQNPSEEAKRILADTLLPAGLTKLGESVKKPLVDYLNNLEGKVNNVKAGAQQMRETAQQKVDRLKKPTDESDAPRTNDAQPESTESAPDAPSEAPANPDVAEPVATEAANDVQDAVDISRAARSQLRDDVIDKLRRLPSNQEAQDVASGLERGESGFSSKANNILKNAEFFDNDEEAGQLASRMDAMQAARQAVQTGAEDATTRAQNLVQAARDAGQTTDSTLARALRGADEVVNETSEAADVSRVAGAAEQVTKDAGQAVKTAGKVASETLDEGLDTLFGATADVPGLDVLTGAAALFGGILGLIPSHHGSKAAQPPPNLATPVEQNTGTTMQQ